MRSIFLDMATTILAVVADGTTPAVPLGIRLPVFASGSLPHGLVVLVSQGFLEALINVPVESSLYIGDGIADSKNYF